MAREKIRTVKLRGDSLEKVRKMVAIIEDFSRQGLRLTARQLYYQFVSKAFIPNEVKEYKKLTALLTDARYAGLVDWDAIEDRGRVPETPSDWKNLEGLVESALRAYRLPRWEGQSKYVELWVEKQALAGVLAPLAHEHHATLMVNKGYSSASAMKESASRFRSKIILDEERLFDVEARIADVVEEYGEKSEDAESIKADYEDEISELVRPSVILYLGDHDPSGEDMVRDIQERLIEFGVHGLRVEKVALTMDQVRQYNPPPNPAKIKDPRAVAYIRKFGNKSWEVDALPPDVLARLINSAFARHIDRAKMAEVKKQEEIDKKLLRKAVATLRA